MSEATGNNFSTAKQALKSAMGAGKDSVSLTRGEMQALYQSYPGPRIVKDVSAVFRAQYLRFLQSAVQSEHRSFLHTEISGVTVLPAEDGGVTLFASDGKVTLMARDMDGRCTPDGLRFSVPESAFAACVPPTPFSLQWEGQFCEIEESIPGYAIPDTVYVSGGCLLVMPLSQPEGTDEHDGGALFACGISRQYDWSDREYTLGNPYRWERAAERWMTSLEATPDNTVPQEDIGVGAITIPAVARAMECFPETVWSIRRLPGNAFMMLPNNREDLVIFVAMAVVANPPAVPGWLGSAEK